MNLYKPLFSAFPGAVRTLTPLWKQTRPFPFFFSFFFFDIDTEYIQIFSWNSTKDLKILSSHPLNT